MGQYEHFHRQDSPTRQARAAVQCALDGPMWDNRLNVKVHTINGPVHSHRWPMQAFRSGVIPLTENYAGPHSSLALQPTVCMMCQWE